MEPHYFSSNKAASAMFSNTKDTTDKPNEEVWNKDVNNYYVGSIFWTDGTLMLRVSKLGEEKAVNMSF